MAATAAIFEVSLRTGGRWVIEAILDQEPEAIDFARELLRRPDCERVRVVRQRGVAEIEVFAAARAEGAGEDRALALSADATGAPRCTSIEDLDRPEARFAIGRMLRAWLARERMTPTELLHLQGHLRRLAEAGTLLSAALHATARGQSESGGEGMKARLAQLRGLLEAVLARAKRLAQERPRLDHPDPRAPDAAWAVAERVLGPLGARAGYAYMLSDRLAGLPGLSARVQWLLPALAVADPKGPAAKVLDASLADCLGFLDVVQDLLGATPSRGALLCLLGDLLAGRPPQTREGANGLADPLLDLLRRGRVPEARLALCDRLWRELLSRAPLDRRAPAHDAALLERLIERLRQPDGRLVGGAMTEYALAERRLRARQLVLEGLGMPDQAAALAKAWATPAPPPEAAALGLA